MILRFFLLNCLLIISTCIQAQSNSQVTIQGKVMDKETKEGIPFANIYIADLYKGTACSMDGIFQISIPMDTKQILQVSCLGYASKNVEVTSQSGFLYIELQTQSIELKGFTVVANYQDKTGNSVSIGPEALEYIQPTSITDALLLLPGSIMGNNNIQERDNISIRQAGNDLSTAFGMGVTIDGIPVMNDGNRIQMSGFTGKSSIDPNRNVAVNAGVDLRTLSTDHIENITVTQGIASAKEGNLSSGLIQIHSKKGETPFRFRSKLDPLNKLLYVGKGFKLSEKLGTLHIGSDIVQSASDIRDLKSAYNRITAQLNYNNVFYIGEKKIDFEQKFSLISSFNNMKSDEEIIENQERFKTTYQRYTLSTKVLATLNTAFIDKLDFSFSSDFSNDRLSHDKKVFNQSVFAIQNSVVEGESEGEYLPKTYRTSYYIDNRPRTIYASLNATKNGTFSPVLNYSFDVGSAINYTQNKGEGSVVDSRRPPFPSNSFIRPRPNYEIPALVNMAYYVDSKIRYRKGKHEFISAMGIRASQMFNLPSDYVLNKKLLIEPRLQFSYTMHNQVRRKDFANTFRIGFGIENKLPSADYLYPDKVYQDFIALNAYFEDPAKRLLITYTKIHNPINPEIRENKNKKIELGWDFSWDGYALSLSAFQEDMTGGIEYFTRYTPVAYTYYNELKHPVEGKPSKEDFYSYLKKDFTTYEIPTNSSKVVKRGIEYRLRIPQIEVLKSEIEINGAYYKTLYTSSVPVMFRPSITENNQPYPFVGIYDGFEKNYFERFNTNLWINTHIPKLKLIFTNFIQFVWIETSRLGNDVNPYPSKYLDTDGKITEVTPAEIEADHVLCSMKRDFLSAKYNENRLPVSMILNLKLTKEINRNIRLSFFANNLVHVSPVYQTNYLKTQRNWKAPFFGVEIIVNL